MNSGRAPQYPLALAFDSMLRLMTLLASVSFWQQKKGKTGLFFCQTCLNMKNLTTVCYSCLQIAIRIVVLVDMLWHHSVVRYQDSFRYFVKQLPSKWATLNPIVRSHNNGNSINQILISIAIQSRLNSFCFSCFETSVMNFLVLMNWMWNLCSMVL